MVTIDCVHLLRAIHTNLTLHKTETETEAEAETETETETEREHGSPASLQAASTLLEVFASSGIGWIAGLNPGARKTSAQSAQWLSLSRHSPHIHLIQRLI